MRVCKGLKLSFFFTSSFSCKYTTGLWIEIIKHLCSVTLTTITTITTFSTLLLNQCKQKPKLSNYVQSRS